MSYRRKILRQPALVLMLTLGASVSSLTMSGRVQAQTLEFHRAKVETIESKRFWQACPRRQQEALSSVQGGKTIMVNE
jgi:hypothetical protein